MSSQVRIGLLKEMFQTLNSYTHQQSSWRPGLVDLTIYNELNDMYESDMDNPEFAELLWKKTPDEVMQNILDTNHIFDSAFEFGSEQLFEELRDYLIEEGFIVSVDDVDDEEYQQLLEGEE